MVLRTIPQLMESLEIKKCDLIKFLLEVPQIFTKRVYPANSSTLFPPQIELEMMIERQEFEIIDLSCNIFFTFEFIARLLSCPSKRQFIKRSVNIIDFVALVSFYADAVIWILGRYLMFIYLRLVFYHN